MKNLFKSIASVAIVAMAFAGCSKEATDVTAPITKKGVTVRFNAEVIDETRATLTPDEAEKTFTAAWEDKDQIGFHIDSEDESFEITGSYDDVLGVRKNGYFEARFDTKPANAFYWNYYAYYPYSADNTYGNCQALVPFGGERIQYGNEYNSEYDIMVSSGVAASKMEEGTTIEVGVDENGNAIVMPMKRMTAIAYFHFTTTAEAKTDKVLSVTLSATPSKESAPLAADKAYVHYGETEHQSVENGGTAVNTIKITYDSATAPTAADFKAWFNVFPGTFSDVKLAIETENYTAEIARTGDVMYEAGKLAKVSGKISDSKWVKKSGGESGALTVDELVEAINGGTTSFTGKRVKGYVAAMAADGNQSLSNGTLILVSNSGKQNSAVKLFDQPSVSNRAVDAEGLQVGYEVLVSLDNATVSTFKKNKQLQGLTADDVKIQSDKVNDIVATTVTIAEYNANYAKYENMYLAFENVEPSQEYAAANASMTFTDGASTLTVYNNKRWTEGAAIKVGKQQGTLYGFAQSYDGAPQVSNTDVNQLAAFMPTCSLSADKLSFAANASAAQTVKATLESGYSLGDVTADADWVSATVSGADIKISVSANSGEERTATVTVNVLKDGKIADTKTIAVTQDACFIVNPTINSGASLTTATIKATWTAVANADSYEWRLTAADGTTEINGAKGTVNKPASGDTVSLSADVSACGLTKDTKYVLYVKSIAADGYTVQGDEGKIELTCAEAAAATEEYTLVTDASTLVAGDQVIIVAATKDFAMSTKQNNNNRGQQAITKSNNKIDLTDVSGVQVFTLETGTTSGTFAFNTGKGYIYAASSSSNNLKTETTLSDNSSWTITITSNNATITAQGKNTRNIIKYNSSSNLFSCYKSGQQAVQIYKK